MVFLLCLVFLVLGSIECVAILSRWSQRRRAAPSVLERCGNALDVVLPDQDDDEALEDESLQPTIAELERELQETKKGRPLNTNRS